MKKTLTIAIFGIGFMFQTSVFSAEDDIVMMVRSPEKITYSDGSEVGNTGIYAVTWTSGTNSFVGFNADGTLVDKDNSKIIVEMPSSNSSLKPFLLQIDKNFVTGGTYQLSFLDTRLKNANTGKLETSSPSITSKTESVRSYLTLTSNVSYSKQFSVLKSDEEKSSSSSNYVAAAGFYDPLPEFDFSNNEFLTNYVSNAVTGEYNSVIFSGTYTNSTSKFFPNPTTGITYYDIYRYFDVYRYITTTNFYTYTNIVEKTVTKYDYQTVYVTNDVDEAEETYESVPEEVLRKSSIYTGIIEHNGLEFPMTIKTYKPNAYGVVRMSFGAKIGKRWKVSIFYGLVDDNGCIEAYGRYSGYRMHFSGKDVVGTIVFDNITYNITGEFLK